ncbi:breast carcinoma-amplified sequence 1 isoform X5 [Oryctolagus cuniculus]|uniref:breast carcinoma-amplified sequence 1 isoform X5 n=1 Tax=Oryctolagus cuniculus TaxID=9986 RepID=UPI0038799261
MGNQMSVPQRVEDQESESEADTYKVTWDSECGQNGSAVIVSTHTVQHYDEVDLGISMKTDNVATSSPETMDISAAASANGKNLGKEAKPEAPAAKSRFFLTLSRPVPGRPGDQGWDSSPGSAKLDVSPSKAPLNKDPSESVALPGAAAPGPNAHKTPEQTPAKDQALSATWAPAPAPPESGETAPSKPKDLSFFEKFFKLDKGREKAPSDNQQESKRTEHEDGAEETPGLSEQPAGVPAAEDAAAGEEEGEETGTLSCSVPGDPEEPEAAKADAQTADTTEINSPIMSFFKTLVSPNKAETKKDPEDTGAEKSPTTSPDLKKDTANSVPSGTPRAAKNPKGCSPSAPPQPETLAETAKEGTKEKAGPTSLPLGKLFWKKSVKEDSGPTAPTGAEENVVCEAPVEVTESEEALPAVDLSGEEGAPEDAEVKPKREERKAPRTSFMALLRQMSVKGDGGITDSEEINGKDSSYQTSNSTEKAITPPEPEPAGAAPKGKEGSSKDKKSAAEMSKRKNSKQEAAAAAQCAEQAVVDGNSLQNGDRAQRRPEKRQQSLGGFFKGLGPKRMSDAQVQTDPVSIGPVGKSK